MNRCALLLSLALIAPQALGQSTLTPEDWQADLRFLQKTVSEDYQTLFRKITEEAFDAEVDALHDAIPGMQQHEIVVGLARIVALFGYGHTELDALHAPVKMHRIPVNLYEFDDGIFVQGAHEDFEAIVGSRVTKIEGMPIRDALAAIRPVVPAENDQFMKAHGLNFLCLPEVLHAQRVTDSLKNDITLTLDRDGRTFDLTVQAVPLQPMPIHLGFAQQGDGWLEARDQSSTPLYLKHLDRNYFFEFLPESKTVYVRHNQIRDDPKEPIPAFYQRLFDFVEANDVERLVLDLRLNGGGNNYKNKPIVTGIVKCAKINQRGKLCVIIGRRTFSACQNLVNELDNYTNVIFVGEPTSENINFLGDNRRVVLPNSKTPVLLSFAWWQDKPQWENDIWTQPHLAVGMSFDDYRANRDPVLAAALAVSENDFVVAPVEYVKRLVSEVDQEKVVSEARNIIEDSRFRYVDFEDRFNQTAYELLSRERHQDAMVLFQLNTKLYPDSANAWDSLAEGHWRQNSKEKAITFYNKAIEMDPDGPVGDNARSMLQEIEGED